MTTSFLLGPQRPNVNLSLPLAALGGDGPVAVVSAGWQEVEGDIEHVQQAVARQLVDLRLYARAEEVFAHDAGVRESYRERQDKLIELQRLYRIRLRQSMMAARSLLREDGDPAMLRFEQRHAISQQRALDRHHIRRISAINSDFESRLAELAPPRMGRHIDEIAELLADCETVLITGGNVAVLLNRLQLFGMGPDLRRKNIVAWSAGAMALSDKIVLFHDNTAEGHRDAEVFNEGLGIIGDVVFLPDAGHRLRLGDKVRVALFSRRFAPASCLTLDSGAVLEVDSGRIKSADGVRRLSRNGGLRRLRVR